MVVPRIVIPQGVSSTLISHPKKFAALADVVIAPVWRTEERGSIPRGSTNALIVKWQNTFLVRMKYKFDSC